MGTEAYGRYKESLGTISDDYDRMENALKILEAIIPAVADAEPTKEA